MWNFIFYPVRYDQDCIILELKMNYTPEEAIAQIKEKEYAIAVQRGKQQHRINIQDVFLRVGISYK